MYADENDGMIVNGVAGQQRANELAWTGRDWSSDNSSGQLLPEREHIQAIQNGALWPYTAALPDCRDICGRTRLLIR